MTEIEKTEQGQSKAEPTWFFERSDGFVFAVEEKDAWRILTTKGNWERRDFKMLGMSDGTTYFSMLRQAKMEVADLLEKQKKLQNDLQRYKATEERLRFEELLGDDDDKVKRVVELMGEVQKNLTTVDEELTNFNKNAIARAFDAELEKARGNMTMPRNQDVITPVESDRSQILANMPRR